MGHIVVSFLMIYKLGLNVPNTNKKPCFFNISIDEMIHNLFPNKNNDFLIIVLTRAFDKFGFLKCKKHFYWLYYHLKSKLHLELHL
jgi:hypothetical protein